MDIIITHKNGDFDALAAVVAASKIYPHSIVIMPEPLQTNVRSFVNLYRDLLPLSDQKEVTEKVDSLIIVDTNRKERLGKWAALIERAGQIKVFDHHPGEEDLEADLVKVEAVGATTTILLEEIFKRKLSLTEFEATLFALGIYEDTGCLTYDITTERDALALAHLWERGLKISLIQQYLKPPLTESQKALLEKLIRNSKLYNLNQRRVLISTTRFEEYVSGASVIIRLLDEIEDAGLTIIIVQMTDHIYFAARTREYDLNLLELLSPFDVKGYPGAVSAQLKNTGVEKLRNSVVEFLNTYLPPVITADQAATKPVFTLNSTVSINEAARLLAEKGYKGCPVVEDNKLVGIISHRDLRKGIRGQLGHAPVKGFMTRRLVTAGPEQSLLELRRLMVEHDLGRVPIVNREGDLVGIVTRSDILRHLSFLDRSGRTIQDHKPVDSQFGEDLPDREGDVNSIQSLLNNRLPPGMQKILLQVRELAGRENVQVYLVGGTIRDLLLRYPPEKDFDFVIVGDAITFAFKLQKLMGGKLSYYQQFGTASLNLENELKLDLVTARKEYYSSPAALPQVESSSLKNDLFRRDFSINTMACSLEAEKYGLLYDYYNGRKDLQDKKIRVLYKLSFVDDPLRILRAVRFEQRYAFMIEPETLDLLQKAVARNVLEKVSRSRLNQESRLIYKEPSPCKVLQRLEQLGILNVLYPRARTDYRTWQLVESIEEILYWAGQQEWQKKPDRELVYLSGLLFGLDSVERSAIIRKLQLSRERASIIMFATREAPAAIEKLDQDALNPSAVVSCLDRLPLEAVLLAYALSEKKTVREHIKVYMTALKYISPRLTGSELKKLGLEPGPRYQRIIDSLKKALLDGEIKTPQEELDYVINYLEAERAKEE